MFVLLLWTFPPFSIGLRSGILQWITFFCVSTAWHFKRQTLFATTFETVDRITTRVASTRVNTIVPSFWLFRDGWRHFHFADRERSGGSSKRGGGERGGGGCNSWLRRCRKDGAGDALCDGEDKWPAFHCGGICEGEQGRVIGSAEAIIKTPRT